MEQQKLFEIAPEPELTLTRKEFDEVMGWRAQRLIELGEMPSLDAVAAAVETVRRQRKARHT